MPELPADPRERAAQLAAARDHARRTVTGLARDQGAELVTRPLFSGSDLTTRDLEPLPGAAAARDVELEARAIARQYVRDAREAGHGWDQIGQALHLVPGADTDQGGFTVAEAAYAYAAGRPDSEAPWRPRSFPWRCGECDKTIGDLGLIGGPADNEPGHATDCPRLAAALAEWDAECARWDAEWEAGR